MLVSMPLRDQQIYQPADIERFYNRECRHGYLGNISPAQYEDRTSGT